MSKPISVKLKTFIYLLLRDSDDKDSIYRAAEYVKQLDENKVTVFSNDGLVEEAARLAGML